MIEILLISLATWRIASLIATEAGPFNIFGSIRRFFANRALDNKFFASLSDGIHCVWCVSMWIAPLLTLLISDTMAEFIIYTFASSTGAIIIDSLIRKLDG